MPSAGDGNAAHMRMWLVALGLVGLVGAAAATPAVLHLRYVLRDGRQAVRIELVLLFGLWRRRWRIPRRGTARLVGARGGGFAGRVQRATVPGPAPRRPPAPRRRSPVWRGLDHLRGRVRLRRLRLRLVVGTGDPALSAVAVGGLHAVIGAAITLLPAYFRLPPGFRPEVAAAPDYRRSHLRVELECIADARLGHLTFAVLLALTQNWRARPGGGPAAPRGTSAGMTGG